MRAAHLTMMAMLCDYIRTCVLCVLYIRDLYKFVHICSNGSVVFVSSIGGFTPFQVIYVCTYVRMYVQYLCMYVCMHVCVCTYVCVYIRIYEGMGWFTVHYFLDITIRTCVVPLYTH